jgi:superfamily I DNA and RNA helicase
MLNVTYGDTRHSDVVAGLVQALGYSEITGDLYVGYPVLNTADGKLDVDALLISLQHGLVAFDLKNPQALGTADDPSTAAATERQDELYAILDSKLKTYPELRKGRGLAFSPQTVSIVPDFQGNAQHDGQNFATFGTLAEVLETFPPISPVIFRKLSAAIQHTSTIKPTKKRTDVTKPDSRGAILKRLEAEIANLDAWQKKAAIEFPEGPQRIRGLAGSGKTIVLAQKAAFLHTRFPDWNIALTFQTRSLYQQFRNLITRFCFEFVSDAPDWSKLHLLHAWGSSSSSGVYAEVASAVGSPIRDFSFAKERYGASRAFEGICKELLKSVEARPPRPLWDVVLIDEAQDFPSSFFEIIYHSTPAPHRIVWAYDELQNLGEFAMKPAEELFGQRADGRPRVVLQNREGQPQQDIVLPVCYRNTKWSLTSAHGTGFGVYRPEGLVQIFDTPSLWEDIGYRFARGRPKGNTDVSIIRKEGASPAYFEELLNPQDAVKTEAFRSAAEQYNYIADQIEKNLSEDELDYDDILVVFCSPLTIRTDAAGMSAALRKRKIVSHLAGITSSRDKIFSDNSIALTGIYRAKGNEAPMVYVADAQYCVSGFELARRRNILFTAMTRSRAWVRVTGVGAEMAKLKSELDRVAAAGYALNFRYPTKEEIKKIHLLHQDMPADQKERVEADLEALARIVRRIDEGLLDPASLSAETRRLVTRFTEKSIT